MKLLLIFIGLTYITSCKGQSQNTDSNKKQETPKNKVTKLPMRALEQLINKDEPAWTLIEEWKSNASNTIEVLPKDEKRADSALFHAQVTTRSPMGAIIYETGGILIDGGWIRILGSGGDKLDRGLMEWNKGKSYNEIGEPLSFLIIADDVLGGSYAINAGGLDSVSIGKVFYFAPETLRWENIDLTYSEFINFCFNGDLNLFYQNLRWTGWIEDIKDLNGNQIIQCYPFLYTEEGKNINTVSRKAVPIQENWDLTTNLLNK